MNLSTLIVVPDEDDSSRAHYIVIIITVVGLLVPEGIIGSIVGVSVLTWFIRYIHY